MVVSSGKEGDEDESAAGEVDFWMWEGEDGGVVGGGEGAT